MSETIVVPENGYPGLLFDVPPPGGVPWRRYIAEAIWRYQHELAARTATRADFERAKTPCLHFSYEVGRLFLRTVGPVEWMQLCGGFGPGSWPSRIMDCPAFWLAPNAPTRGQKVSEFCP